MLKRIAGWVLIITGVLTAIFFREYSGDIIPYPFVFFVAGITLGVSGLWLIYLATMAKQYAMNNETMKQIDNIKRNGERIIVDFSKCEIKENNYSEEREIGASARTQALNALQDDRRNVIQVSVDTCRIVFTYNNSATGKTEKFVSDAIAMDRITLSVRLNEKRQTTLYVDRKDRGLYFFDTDFLSR